MTFVEIKSLDDIKPGMRFITPPTEDRGTNWPERDWRVTAVDDLGSDANGNVIQNKWRNKFLAKTDDMENPILFCFDPIDSINKCGVKFYQP